MTHRLKTQVVYKEFAPSLFSQPIFVMQSRHSRAINTGFLEKRSHSSVFIPGRLNLGADREKDTYQATIQSLQIAPVKKILKRFKPGEISTVTVLRETLSCGLNRALDEIGISPHFGDAFIGASHIKGDGEIRTAYLYENIEGLHPKGLWIIADSICIGRNLASTMQSLLKKFQPAHILFISPIASRIGINNIGKITAGKNIPTTFVAWGALFGVDEETLYDMPWGHPDTQALDQRDQDLAVSIYGKNVCMGGDFGNNYYCPDLAIKLYQTQLTMHYVKPKIPSGKSVLKIYERSELLIRN